MNEKARQIRKKRKNINGIFRIIVFFGIILLLIGGYGFKETYLSSGSSWSGSKSSKIQNQDTTATFITLGGGIVLIIVAAIYRNSTLLEEQVTLTRENLKK